MIHDSQWFMNGVGTDGSISSAIVFLWHKCYHIFYTMRLNLYDFVLEVDGFCFS
jgi:hypothetical protein